MQDRMKPDQKARQGAAERVLDRGSNPASSWAILPPPPPVAAPTDPPTALPEHLPQAGPCAHRSVRPASWLLGEILMFVNKDSGGTQPGSSSPICRWRKSRLLRRKRLCLRVLLGPRLGFLENGGTFPALDTFLKAARKNRAAPHTIVRGTPGLSKALESRGNEVLLSCLPSVS